MEAGRNRLEVTHSPTPCWSEGLGPALVLATGACGDLGVRGAVSLSHTLPMTPVLGTMLRAPLFLEIKVWDAGVNQISLASLSRRSSVWVALGVTCCML